VVTPHPHVAFSGYKYIALCVNLAVGVLGGKRAYWAALAWTGASTTWFMLKVRAPINSAWPLHELRMISVCVSLDGRQHDVVHAQSACYWHPV
jgi:hypothetical protein